MLWGLYYQTDENFEVVVADDGSQDNTSSVIDRFRRETGMEIRHVWQEDDGFQKCKILNKAIVASSGDYLIVTDGDCIPRKDFVFAHRKHARPGCFLSGGYFKLPMSISELISQQHIADGLCFDSRWLESKGLKPDIKSLKLIAPAWLGSVLNRLTLTNRTWNGHNASGWKKDALRVNGFDERMQYGGLGCEFGDRLINLGIKPKQIRYSAIAVHLDHERGYVSEEVLRKNRIIRRRSIDQKIIETPAGIKQRLSRE